MTAYGDNPSVHRIAGGRFVCSASPEAPCRTIPTCDCEYWCGCDGAPEDDRHDAGEHCCSTTKKPGQACWIEPWIAAGSLADSYEDDVLLDDLEFPDGRVTCEWEDEDTGVVWSYADGTRLPDVDDDGHSMPRCGRACPGCETCQPAHYADLLSITSEATDA